MFMSAWLRKSVDKALALKEHGNALYKERKIKDSIQIYTKVMQKYLHVLSSIYMLDLSHVMNLTLQAVLYAPPVIHRGDSNRYTEEFLKLCEDKFLQKFLTKRLPVHEENENLILSHCYGNRSAALFELKEYEVICYIIMIYILAVMFLL